MIIRQFLTSLLLLPLLHPSLCGVMETRLLKHLLNDTSPYVRPVYNPDDPVMVTFGFTLVQIVNLNEHKQSIAMKIWLRMHWLNEYMQWKPEKWNNITLTRIEPGHVWRPDIFLEEDVGQDVTSGLHSHKTSIIMSSNGEQTWMVPVMLHGACRVDVAQFPFDQQKCKLVFTPWTHNQLEMDIKAEDKKIITSHYVESSEWILIGVEKNVNSMKYDCCDTPYVNIEYEFTLQRKPLYYIHNLVTPCVLQMIIILSTFFLPLESGERIGVVITILLVFAVYLQVLRESLPESSSSTPLLSKFFILVMGESACLLITTCAILKVHYKGLQKGIGRVPGWARKIFLEYGAKLVFFSHQPSVGPAKVRSKEGSLRACSLRSRLERGDNLEDLIQALRENANFLPQSTQVNYTHTFNNSNTINNNNNNNSNNINNTYNNNNTLFSSDRDHREVLLTNSNNTCRIVRDSGDRLINEVRAIKDMIKDMNAQDNIEEEWLLIAKVLDRICFFIFFVIYAVSSFTMLIPAYLEYQKHCDAKISI